MTYAFVTKVDDNGKWSCQITRLHNKYGSQIWFNTLPICDSETQALTNACDWLINYIDQAPFNFDITEFC